MQANIYLSWSFLDLFSPLFVKPLESQITIALYLMSGRFSGTTAYDNSKGQGIQRHKVHQVNKEHQIPQGLQKHQIDDKVLLLLVLLINHRGRIGSQRPLHPFFPDFNI